MHMYSYNIVFIECKQQTSNDDVFIKLKLYNSADILHKCNRIYLYDNTSIYTTRSLCS